MAMRAVSMMLAHGEVPYLWRRIAAPCNHWAAAEHRYLNAQFDALGDVCERVMFVVHDCGSALGFDWANGIAAP
jgi:hypothetical protein